MPKPKLTNRFGPIRLTRAARFYEQYITGLMRLRGETISSDEYYLLIERAYALATDPADLWWNGPWYRTALARCVREIRTRQHRLDP